MKKSVLSLVNAAMPQALHRSLILTVLSVLAIGAGAADYLIKSGDYYIGMNTAGIALQAYTTPNASCVWTCRNNNTDATLDGNASRSMRNKKNTDYYLYTSCSRTGNYNPTYTWATLSASTTASAVWRGNDNNFYAYYYENNWYTRNASINVSNNGNTISIIDNSQNNSQYYLGVANTAETEYTGGLTAVNVTNSTLTYEANTALSLDASQRKREVTPASTYTVFAVGATSYYWHNNDLTGEKPKGNSTDIGLTSYTWSISGTGAEYLSLTSTTGNTNTITYNKPCPNDGVTATVSVTAKYAQGDDITKTTTINLNKYTVNPTGIDASDIELSRGETETIQLTLTCNIEGYTGIYRNITYTSADTGIATVDNTGKVTGVATGETTITMQAKQLDGTEPEALKKTINVKVNKPKIPTPNILITSEGVTLSCEEDDVTFYYTTDGSTPTTSSTHWDGNAFIPASDECTIKVIATKTDYQDSQVAEYTLKKDMDGSGTEAAPYLISNALQLKTFADHLGDSGKSSAWYKVTADIAGASGYTTPTTSFTGHFDGGYHTIDGLSQALFSTVNNGTIKNVRLENVSVSGTNNVGALANTATGNSRIYNCGVLSGRVSGTGNVGGLIGGINGNTKVVNNYNFASVSGGTNAAGVVGNVSTADTAITVRFKHVDSGLYLSANGAKLQIRTDGSDANYQSWTLEPSGNGFKIKNNGSNQYICQSNANDWTAGFNETGDVYTIVKQADETYFINRANGNHLGTDYTTNNSTVYTNKTNDTRTKWQVEPSGALDFSPMVANCVNYGTEVSGPNIYPVYGGTDLDNKTKPLYDFFLYDDAEYRESIKSTNSALPAEARFLNRFEYVRATLNAEKKLAAYHLFDTQNKADQDEIGKWVLDKEIAPYPIIKPWGKYPSLVNPDVSNRTVGELSVNISGHGTVQLPISDQCEEEFDYGYHKVQLPYYNDYFTDNYQANKVVTGWIITSVTGGTAGTFSKEGNNAYNFADRNCTQKDLYSVSGRVFAQGGFYYVPEGVTGITIEPYWANDVVYAYDPNIDKVFGTGYAETNYGPTYTPTFTLPTGAKVQTNLRNAQSALTQSYNVYDHAIVLIGNINFRQNGAPFTTNNQGRAYTLMSIDEDKDNEPDYCEFYGHVNMQNIPPTRLDFVHQVGISWVKKPMGESLQSYSGIALTRGHFEITETAFARFTEFETGQGNDYFENAPLIFNAGLIDQFVMSRDGNTNKVNYAIVGGHTYFNAYTPGSHTQNTRKTTFFPVSVMGGEYEEFYLTGRNANVTVDNNNNGRVYTNGGKMGTFAGGYWEQLNGNAYIRFDHTQVKEFYGGSVNPTKPITGNIDIVINNSDVEFFCAGPKAGNMAQGKTVTTIANNTKFGTYVGAGYGGSSVARVQMVQNVNGNDYNYYKNTFFNNYFNNNTYLQYNATNGGILIRYAIEFMPGSGGMGNTNAPTHVTRFFCDYAQLSLARTYNVTSTLTGCTITGNYYGGPWSGTVGSGTGTAPTVKSTLKDCTVQGNVFGGGKSAEIPSITVYPSGASALKTPLYNGNFGMYYQEGEDEFPVYPEGTEYTWVAQSGNTPKANSTAHTLETNVDLNNLGTIFGNTDLTIDGGVISGNVFGAGDASKVTGNTKVTVLNNATIGNVYGAGNEADLGGNTDVDITGGTMQNVFGGGNLANCSTTNVDVTGGMVATAVYGGGALANVTGNTVVNLLGGTVHDTYGGGLGRDADTEHGITAVEALVVGNTNVTLNGSIVTGSIFGCNNLNGTPKGTVKVLIQKTTPRPEQEEGGYDVPAVYGGGNQAPYIPKDDILATAVSEVYVEGCDNSVEYIYGGGNAASSPATKVTIEGGDIYYVFGGGNGAGEGNPGADVGYKDFTYDTSHEYGAGTATVNIYGGVIESVFGGSNTRGNIRESANVNLDDAGACPFNVKAVYGAGNEAEMYGRGNLVIGCIPGLEEIYGGAKNADIHGDVSLTITNGTFGKVFGGNNLGGNIEGSITVNIEETGCRPVIIGELYGGGNLAAYTAPTADSYGDDKGKFPIVNVKSCTSIESVFGGGLGMTTEKLNALTADEMKAEAKMHGKTDEDLNALSDDALKALVLPYYKEKGVIIGSPQVNVGLIEGKFANGGDYGTITFPAISNRWGNKLGTIGEVFGGGNAAKVDGDTYVNIGTKKQITLESKDPKDPKDVQGVNISGNVYGGGNAADVTGKTHVQVGPKPTAPTTN